MAAFCRFLVVFTIFVFERPLTSAYFEFCHENKPYKVKQADCEGGLWFNDPIDIECMYPKEQEYTVDICSDEKYSYDSTGATDYPKLQYLVMSSDDQPIDTNVEPYKTLQCGLSCQGEAFSFTPTSAPVPEETDNTPTSYTASEERENTIPGIETNDKHVKEQTERLFLYLSGLLVDEGEKGPNTRLAQIMRMTFDIFRSHCPKEFVPEIFGEQLEKAFFFLLREGDLGKMKDISEEDFEKIKSALLGCKHVKPTPFVLDGKVCQTKAIVKNISSTVIDLTVSYARTIDSFVWGKYDLPVDSAWMVSDFVHGLCYGKFSQNINKHHQYEVAIERLFTPELVYRWERPFKLGFPEAWDHLLQADLRDVMRNLDACRQGAYLGSPFLRNLQRPIMKVEEAGRRKRRQASDDEDWAGKAICFPSSTEATTYLESLKKNCPAKVYK